MPMEIQDAGEQRAQLAMNLPNILNNLQQNPYPSLPSPASTKRRASVAVIIRFAPSFDQWPPSNQGSILDLDEFFSQPWVQHAEPEVLLIKRAERKGDRWTSHIALPGGKRDPEDVDDEAVAIRETQEEIGLDLNRFALQCGNLPQQIVPTPLGSKPLMVLCPYIFLLKQHQVPPLRLQPAEVAAAYWVPIRTLLSPTQWTLAFEDISRRLSGAETGPLRWLLKANLGPMLFSAIELIPTETRLSDSKVRGSEMQSTANRQVRLPNVSRLGHLNMFPRSNTTKQEGLLMWGLTLGVLVDFLNLIPQTGVLSQWIYPTFLPLDVRFFVWSMTRGLRNRKQAEARAQGNKSLVPTMLNGYYPVAQRAVKLALFTRAIATVGLAGGIAWMSYPWRWSSL